MSEFIKHYTLKFTSLSPLHIGGNESYEPGNYVIDDGALFGFDTLDAMKGLTNQDQQQLLKIVNAKADDTMLTRVQAFFYQHKEKLIAYASPAIPVAKGVHDLYRKRIGKIAQQENNGRRVINKLEIERTFYNPVNNLPLLPGSSIKGAIRTAMLDKENEGEKLNHKGERNRDLQTRLLKNDQFHTDPFRLISLADASWHGGNERPNRQIQFAVNRKRKAVYKDGKLIQSQAEASNLYQLLECIAPYHFQGFTGSLTIHQVDSVTHDAKKFPANPLQWTITDIASGCNRFYKALLKQELEQMQERNYLDSKWSRQIEHNLTNGLLEKINNNQGFLLRLGRHSGAEALTLSEIRSIKIMQGRKNSPTFEKEPKTWWFAADQINARQGLLPFGWVWVDIDPEEENNDLKDWLEKGHDHLRAWMFEKNQLQEQLRQKQQKLKAREQERFQLEEQRQQQEQAKKQAEAERKAKLSPIEREIDEFLEPIQDQDRDTRLLQELESGRWQGEDVRTVAKKVQELMDAKGKWMPDFTGSNKKKLKLKDRSLKVQSYLD